MLFVTTNVSPCGTWPVDAIITRLAGTPVVLIFQQFDCFHCYCGMVSHTVYCFCFAVKNLCDFHGLLCHHKRFSMNITIKSA